MSNPVFGSSPVFADPVKRRGEKPRAQNVPPSAPYGQQAPYGQPYAADANTLNQMYQAPAATSVDTGRLTYDDVIMKTGGLIALLIVVAAGTWMVADRMPGLYIAGALVGFVLAMVNIFKKTISPALIIAYTVAEGVFLGGLSAMLNAVFPGVALQAFLATVITFAVTLVAFKSGKVRVTAKSTKIFMIAMLGYLAFSLVNVGIMLFGGTDAAWGLRTSVTVPVIGLPLGVVVGVVAVLLAAYSLVIDFDSIKRGVEQGAPAKFAWKAAFGLIVTLVWLYVEFLRIFAILAGRD